MSGPSNPHRWIDYLSEEELAFVRRFVMASGSLKKVASQYSISYPTVRLRLDRLIEKIRLVEEAAGATHFERTLEAAHTDGRIDATTKKRLLDAYHQEKERGK
jgi:hypothetical protein